MIGEAGLWITWLGDKPVDNLEVVDNFAKSPVTYEFPARNFELPALVYDRPGSPIAPLQRTLASQSRLGGAAGPGRRESPHPEGQGLRRAFGLPVPPPIFQRAGTVSRLTVTSSVAERAVDGVGLAVLRVIVVVGLGGLFSVTDPVGLAVINQRHRS